MMSEPSQHRRSFRPTNQQLRYAGAALAYLVAALHLFHPKHGFTRLILLLSVNSELLVSDPRPVAFVLSGIAIIIGVPMALIGFPRRVLYALGLVLTATYITGYFAWHLSGHGGVLPGREPLYHGLAPQEAVLAHLSNDVWAAVTVIAEAILIGVLAFLYSQES